MVFVTEARPGEVVPYGKYKEFANAIYAGVGGPRIEDVADRLRQGGADSVAALGSPRLTNEENYLFQKLFRAAVGTNNIDSEARFGALRALKALDEALGLKGASNRIAKIGAAAAVLVFGSDVTAEAPAIDWQIEQACRKRDGKLVVAEGLTQQEFGERAGTSRDMVNRIFKDLAAGGYITVRDDRSIRSNLVLSQIAEHRPYGGVVPEIAARSHLDRNTSVLLLRASSTFTRKRTAGFAPPLDSSVAGPAVEGWPSLASARLWTSGLRNSSACVPR